MSFEAKVLLVMIASPSDVPHERDAVEQAINDWNQAHARQRGYVLLPWRWEKSAFRDLSTPGQDLIDAQGVDRSDIVIALFGSRLGAPTATAVSGTVGEVDRALAQGKRVHLYFSQGMVAIDDIDPAQLEGLREFKTAITARGLYGTFADLPELRRLVEREIGSDIDLLEEMDDPTKSLTFNVTDRVYTDVSVDWEFSPSPTNPRVWDGTTLSRRQIVGRGEGGLEVFTISLSRGGQSSINFGQSGELRYELLEATRSGHGSIEMRNARKNEGTEFAQDLHYLPPLADGEESIIEFAGKVPGFKYASQEDVVSFSRNTKMGIRDWDYVGWKVTHPTQHLRYSVFLPDSLRATPTGAAIGRITNDQQLSAALNRDNYSQERSSRNGVEGWLMTLDVQLPLRDMSYRLTWRPPATSNSSN